VSGLTPCLATCGIVALVSFVACSASSGGAADLGVGRDQGVRDLGPRDALPACPTFGAGVAAGVVRHLSVREASGLTASRLDPGVLWTHNDSGDLARFFGLTVRGEPAGTFVLVGVAATDWEDVAVGPDGAGGTALHLADTGDNEGTRREVQVYRVPEPRTAIGDTPPRALDAFDTIRLRYPDGPHDVESVLVDPLLGDLYLVVKSSDGVSPVFRARAPLVIDDVTTLEHVTTLRFGKSKLPGKDTTTAGDFAPRGDALAIRTGDSAFLWRRPAGWSVDEALAEAACPLPIVAEAQGEAFAFAADGDAYFTLGEGEAVTLWSYPRGSR
jgi:hypothetical protein